ncbi:MAG TPA: YitT family protein [Candidatus Pygmaiobacter gallistercoris]|nr:YitT family protein [Candidatus Pygmaiobacter gallistercoris]
MTGSKNKRIRKDAITLIGVVLSAALQAYVIKVFMNPSNLISSGFTGVAQLINLLTETTGFHIDTSLGILLLNIPVALLCARGISPRFTLFSCIQFGCASLFLKLFQFEPLMQDVLLNVAFGGFLYGICVVIALKVGASTGGTDFVALYFSNKFGKSLWQYVFLFNTTVVLIFGAFRGWTHAGYSIVFQLISTKTISTFHTRYERLTMQITTEHPQELLAAYTAQYRHGISCVDGYGGYSHQPFTVMTTVVSSYEVKEIIHLMKEVDPKVIINIYKTVDFVGGFYRKPID